uniref:Uncharacterized protein n=1 Tax=Anguilla anguilla TaxID=7936 RepID=A0A0E9TMK5_ANGAN
MLERLRFYILFLPSLVQHYSIGIKDTT